MSKIIFIGGIKEGQVPDCGETVKNQLLINQLHALNHTIITIDTLNWRRRPLLLFRMFFSLLFNRGAKVIISASGAASYLISFLYYFPLKKNVYFWVIGGDLHLSVGKGRYNINALKALKSILVEGNNMKVALSEFGIYNVIVAPNFKPIVCYDYSNENRNADKIKFVFLSRVHPDKGVREIVEAARLLCNQGYTDKFVVDFYGKIEPSFESEFMDLVAQTANVKYRGFLNLMNTEGYKKLSDYDVMLFPTYWDGEGFPGVVLDANMAGVPIIASDWNMNTEVIMDGYTGFIVPTYDIETLVFQMRRVIEGKVDLIQLRKNCLEWVRKFDVKNVVTKELLRQIGVD